MTGFPDPRTGLDLAKQVQALQQKLALIEKCVQVDAAGNLTLKSQSSLKIEGLGIVEIKGSLIKLN